MLDAFEAVERLLIVAAHPDDLETMCGGTAALLARRGVQIFSVNCTLGDIGASAEAIRQDASVVRPALASTRLAEAEAAARILGVEQTFNLGRHDGELIPNLALRAQIARLYRITGADTLWTFDPFWPGQIHPDHRAAGQAALDAYMPAKMPLYRPEQLQHPNAALSCVERIFLFGTERDPNIFVDITDIYDTKLAAAMAHESQFPKGEPDLEWMKERDRRHGEAINVAYAEALLQVEVW
ncbi:MAG: PIG-L deacetylase family protein [Candidatus Promineifilaceae bacterium]|nr:PIG-L deacetylase family protein [Candidatus Promineifilaceae bacterium]